MQLTTGMLVGLLAFALPGCNSTVQPAAPQEPAAGHTNQPAAVARDSAQFRAPQQPALTQQVPLASAVHSKLVIEVNRATDSIDLATLQSGKKLPIPPWQLTVDLSQAPLRAVLQKLARKLDAMAYIADSVPELRISLQLNGVSVAEGIRQILRDTSYVLIYKKTPTSSRANTGEDEAGEPAIAEIRVFSKGNVEATSSVSLKALQTADETAEVGILKKRALTAEKPEDRLAALKEFLERADPSEHGPVLLAALKDQAPAVRMHALNSMGDSANLSLEPISNTALRDESPTLRTAAMDVLLSRFGAGAVPTLEQALADPDPKVQRAAQSSLEMARRVEDLLESMAGQNPGE